MVRVEGGGFLVSGVLELDHTDGQAVEKEHDVRPAGALQGCVGIDHRALDADAELVDSEPVVGGEIVKINDAGVDVFGLAGVERIADGYAVDEEAVEAMVVDHEVGALRAGKLAEGIVQRRLGQVGIEAGQDLAQAAGEDHVAVGLALGAGLAGGDVWAADGGVAYLLQPFEGGEFDVGFGERDHRVSSKKSRSS